jgi:hypothetical protein
VGGSQQYNLVKSRMLQEKDMNERVHDTTQILRNIHFILINRRDSLLRS